MVIALVQMHCAWGKAARNLRRMELHARTARERGADLVVFPETTVHGLWKDHLVRLYAQALDGPAVVQLQSLARALSVNLAFGLAERTAGKPHNAYVVVDRTGALVGVHRKNYVTPLESTYYRPHHGRPVFAVDGVRMAVGICADCSHLELLRSFRRRGARVVLMPHAWDADPILRDGRPAGWRSMEQMVDANARGQVARYRTHAEMLRRFVERAQPSCRALGLHGLFANQVGRPHPLIPFVGPAFAMDPQGRVLAQSRHGREGLVMAEIQP